MECPKCGSEIEKNQKKCDICGYVFSNGKNPTFYLLILIFIAFFIYFLNNNRAKETPVANNKVNNETSAETKAQVLSEVEKYQEKYFSIIKRNDMLLQINDYTHSKNDYTQLAALYVEVERKIKPNEYLEKYYEVEQTYKDNPGNTTVEMNNFASREYAAVDDLLNEVYVAVKNQISQEDFKKLQASQKKWLKQVEEYYEVFQAQGFGTIGTLVNLGYEINMRKFRTLLLMLYF